jgi:hypothetical protein
MTAVALAQRLNLTQPAITMAMARGKGIAKERAGFDFFIGVDSERVRG